MDHANSEHWHGEEVVYISNSDLPLSCPMPEKRLWDSHPKVYLPIASTGSITCPYCSTTYHLIEEDAKSSSV